MTVRPGRELRYERTMLMPRTMGESVASNENSEPAMASSQTEK